MKNRPDPSTTPQTEGHPEPFPEVTTMPKGWDLSEMIAPQTMTFESIQSAIPLELDRNSAVEDRLA
jgi:hypothetical protein